MRSACAVLAAAVIALAALTGRPQAAGSEYAWHFEVVESLPPKTGCAPSVLPDALRVDPHGKAVVAWRESGCGLPPYDMLHTGFRWAQRDPHTFAWNLNTVIDQTCTSLGCVGLRGNPPALALRSDGAPFYIYGIEGQWENIRLTTVNLADRSSGANPVLGE